MGSNNRNYGHLSRQNKPKSKRWQYIGISLFFVWGLAVLSLTTQRLAALFDFHKSLGKALFNIGEMPFYWPFKALEWASKFEQYEEVGKIVDQAYLLFAGVPLLIFIIYMATQEGLNPVLDLNGNQAMKWNEKSIIYRMENMPKDPRIDNLLKVTNDARKAGLDFRLINPNAADFKDSKINLVANEILRIHKDWESDKGTQLVFCDLSTPKTSKITSITSAQSENKNFTNQNSDSLGNEEITIAMDEILAANYNFSVYDDLKTKLITKGVLENEIKFIHDAKTDLQKAKLFDEVNKGNVRILIGSTFKMGAGTNVQKRLVAEHHLDAPWRPSDLAQREGRIVRQGNELFERDPDHFEVEIIHYATEQTYDARMYQTIL